MWYTKKVMRASKWPHHFLHFIAIFFGFIVDNRN